MDTAKQIKQAVLIELNPDESMLPLLEHRSIAMLPVGGKPLVQFWCEQLHLSGIKSLHLIICNFPEQVRQFLDDGSRWGLEVTLSTIPEKTPFNLLVRQIHPFVKDNTLLSNFQMFPTQILKIDEASVNCISLESDQSTSEFLKYDVITAQEIDKMVEGNTVQIKTGRLSDLRYINHPKHLWQLNMDLIRGKIEDPLPVGFENDEGILIDVGVQIKPYVKLFPQCRIGKNSLLQESSKIGPDAVVGKHCIIDESCQVIESVVFDNTYVGSHSNLNRVLADGRLVYQIDQELATWIDDPAIIGSMQIKTQSVGLFGRLFAFILLLICIPGLLIHLLLNIIKPKPVFIKETIYIPVGRDLAGKTIKQLAIVPTLNVKHPLWRKIPWLLSVMTGKLYLLGITAEFQKSADIPEWARELSNERPGVINLYDISGADHEIDNRFVTDSYYLTTKSFKNDLFLIVKWFSKLLTPYATLS